MLAQISVGFGLKKKNKKVTYLELYKITLFMKRWDCSTATFLQSQPAVIPWTGIGIIMYCKIWKQKYHISMSCQRIHFSAKATVNNCSGISTCDIFCTFDLSYATCLCSSHSKILFFLFLHENICCGYSLEATRWGTSNEYPRHTFSWRNQKDISIFRMKKAPYLLLCSSSWLTLVVLNPHIPWLCKQCRSRWSKLIWICTVCHSVCDFVSTT